MKDCFQEVLEHLRGTFQVLWHTYLLTPEVHPDFDDKYAEFQKQYKKNNGEAKQDPEYSEKAWRTFWKDWIKKQLRIEKQKSKLALLENFRLTIKNSERASLNRENQPKRVKMDEENEESHKSEDNCANSNTIPSVFEKENSQLLLHSPSRVYEKPSHVSLNVLCQVPPRIDLVNLPVFPNTSDQLSHSVGMKKARSLSPSLKGTTTSSHSFDSCSLAMSHYQWIISEISNATSNSKTELHHHSLNKEPKESSRKRVQLILRCFKILTEFSQTLGTLSAAVIPIIKSVLEEGVHSEKVLDILSDPDCIKVMQMCSERLRRVGEENKGICKENLLQCSSDIDELLESISNSVMNLEMIEGLHIPTIAKLTSQKDMPSVLQFLRDALAIRNVHNPPKSLINKLFLAVSTYHSISSTQNLSTLPVAKPSDTHM